MNPILSQLLIFSFFTTLAVHQVCVAEQLIEEHIKGTSKASQPAAAKQEILDEAVERVAHTYFTKFLGEEKVKKNRTLIKTRILSQSGKFIPYIKSSDLSKNGNLFEMEVHLQVSTKNLKELLLNLGLLYESDGPIRILPLVSFFDRRRLTNLQWWSTPASVVDSSLRQINLLLDDELETRFRKESFFVFQPFENRLGDLLPPPFKGGGLSEGDASFATHYFEAHVGLVGKVVLEPDPDLVGQNLVILQIEARHSRNGRVLGQVFRKESFAHSHNEEIRREDMTNYFKEVAEGLATQVLQSWKSGTFESIPLRLTLRGPATFSRTQNFKSELSNLPQIKAIRERRLSAKERVYEVDSSVESTLLKDLLTQVRFDGFTVRALETSSDSLILELY